MILPNGSPRIIAIEVPVTTILSASERNFSDTTLTAAGDAIDQNTECVHATPIREKRTASGRFQRVQLFLTKVF